MSLLEPGRSTRRELLRLGAGLAAGLTLGPRLALAQTSPDSFDADVGLDPGHSRVDVGAAGAGVGEYRHTLDVAQRLQPLLEAAGLRVRMTRADHEPLSAMSHPNSTERVRIEQLARIAAAGKVRAYVSIHFNAAGASNTTLSGTETYFNSENAGSDSHRLAEAIQRRLVAQLWEYGHPAVDRGVKEDLLAGKPYGHFFSLRGGMPSVLVEGLFLSNPTEANLLLASETRQAIAQGYAAGILEYFGLAV